MHHLHEILPYSIDVVSACINDFTDTPISVIKRKPFINYLDSYLSNWKTNESEKNCGISFIIEKDYVDFSFLQDYSSYYVKCFNQYNRNCIRLHFFSYDYEALSKIYDYELSSCDAFIKDIHDKYLGFIVIRPIPTTFIARACLRRYEPTDGKKHYLIDREVKSHLLGIDFSVRTVPFIEQDKVLSVCATSALWSFFNAHKKMDSHRIPSPYEITTLAINNNSKGIGLLNNGLTIEMMCNCIKNNNLVPLNYELHNEKPFYFYELIHVFVSSGYPVILGLAVYNNKPKKNKKYNEENFIGLHAVVVLGDELGDEINFKSDLSACSNYISKMYIHDDRIGPYARLQYKNESWILKLENSSCSVEPETQYYVPSEIVIGVYQKIRLPFSTVWNFAYYLNNDLIQLIESHDDPGKEVVNFFRTMCWDFKFEEGALLKNRIRFAEIDKKQKERLLNLSLPLYCWVIKAYFLDTKALGFEIIIDATDISQGNYIIDILYYDEIFEDTFKRLRDYYLKLIKENGGTTFNELIQHSLWTLYKWLTKSDNYTDVLDFLYGETKIPKYFKSSEINNDEIRNQKPIVITRKDDVVNFSLDKNKKYIWVIDKDGFLIIGEEDQIVNSDNKGHPTLLCGRPGRIAGELEFKNNSWYVNSKSGRYSNPKEDSEIDVDRYVNNAINEKFKVFFPTEDFIFQPRAN